MNKETRETMWAELEADCYDGPDCDQISVYWNCYADGDKDSDKIYSSLEIDPKVFPPGTKVTIEEPVCPECHEVRYYSKTSGEFPSKCDCGFDWENWVIEKYA